MRFNCLRQWGWVEQLRLWHGQVRRALDLIGETLVMLEATAKMASPNAAAASKVAGKLCGLETHVSGQSALIIDYATFSQPKL